MQPDEQEIKRLLASDDMGERRKGLSDLDRKYRHDIPTRLRARHPYLQPAQLADIWRDTVLDMVEKVRDRTFQVDGSLSALLFMIGDRKAIDLYRRQACWNNLLPHLVAGGSQEPASHVRRRVEQLTSVERKECVEVIEQALRELPERQRAAMRAFLDLGPDSSVREVHLEVTRQSEQDTTFDAVRRALQEARVKVRRFLRRKGYDL